MEDKTMTRALVAANPIHFTKIFDNIGGKKVGYLVYNQFSGSFNDELNDTFADFKAEGVQEFTTTFAYDYWETDSVSSSFTQRIENFVSSEVQTAINRGIAGVTLGQ